MHTCTEMKRLESRVPVAAIACKSLANLGIPMKSSQDLRIWICSAGQQEKTMEAGCKGDASRRCAPVTSPERKHKSLWLTHLHPRLSSWTMRPSWRTPWGYFTCPRWFFLLRYSKWVGRFSGSGELCVKQPRTFNQVLSVSWSNSEWPKPGGFFPDLQLHLRTLKALHAIPGNPGFPEQSFVRMRCPSPVLHGFFSWTA